MPRITLDVHDEPIAIDFTIQNFEDSILEIDWTSKDRKPVKLTPEIEAVFSEWWQGLDDYDRQECLNDQHDAEESYAAESEYERRREEGC